MITHHFATPLVRRVLPCRHLNGRCGDDTGSGTGKARQDGAGCRGGRDERGAGTVLMVAVMLITAMVAFVAACLLAWFGHAHRVRAAADLAALAAADAFGSGRDACTAARAAATSNGVTLTACAVDSNGTDFVVRVTVRTDARPRLTFGPAQFTQSSEAGNVR